MQEANVVPAVAAAVAVAATDVVVVVAAAVVATDVVVVVVAVAFATSIPPSISHSHSGDKFSLAFLRVHKNNFSFAVENAQNQHHFSLRGAVVAQR